MSEVGPTLGIPPDESAQAADAPTAFAKPANAIVRRAWWRGLAPSELAMSIPGPIFQKEVRTAGRKPSTYWIRGLYVSAMLGVVTMVFLLVTSNPSEGGGAAQMMQATQQVAPAVTRGAVWFQFVALTLVAAIASSSAICEERRAGTLSALLTTPLRAWQIVMGKVAGSLVQILVLLLAAAPLLLAIRVFGGLTARTVVVSVTLILLHAVLASILAIFYSIRARRAAGAFLIALFSLALIQAGPPLVVFAADQLLQEFGSSLFAVVGYEFNAPAWIMVTATPAALAFSTEGDAMGPGTGIPQYIIRWVWAFNAAYLLIWIVMMFGLSSLVLRRVLNAEAAGSSPVKAAGMPRRRKVAQEPVVAGAGAALVPAPTASTQDGAERVHEFSREVDDNPVMWRELRQSTFTKPWHFWVAGGVCGAMLVFLYIRVGTDDESLHFAVSLICVVVALALSAVGTTAGISGERESRSWDALLTTPLTAWEIVWGKFLGAVRKQWFTPALLLTHLVLAGLLMGGLNISWLLLAPVLVGPIVALGATGVLLSLICRKSSLAATLNFFLALGFYAVLPGTLGALSELTNLPGVSETLESAAEASLIPNPVAMAFVVVEGATKDNYPFHMSTYNVFDLFRLSFPKFFLLVMAVTVGYGVITLTALKMAAVRLAYLTGRER